MKTIELIVRSSMIKKPVICGSYLDKRSEPVSRDFT